MTRNPGTKRQALNGDAMGPVAAPQLETTRLILRAHQESDLDAYATMWGDPNVARFVGGTPSTRQATWFRMLRYVGLWTLLGYGYWAVYDPSDGRYLGDAGLGDFGRGIDSTNTASQRVATKVGFHAVGTTRLGAKEVDVFSRPQRTGPKMPHPS